MTKEELADEDICERCDKPLIEGAWILEHGPKMADERVCEACWQAFYFEE